MPFHLIPVTAQLLHNYTIGSQILWPMRKLKDNPHHINPAINHRMRTSHSMNRMPSRPNRWLIRSFLVKSFLLLFSWPFSWSFSYDSCCCSFSCCPSFLFYYFFYFLYSPIILLFLMLPLLPFLRLLSLVLVFSYVFFCFCLHMTMQQIRNLHRRAHGRIPSHIGHIRMRPHAHTDVRTDARTHARHHWVSSILLFRDQFNTFFSQLDQLIHLFK